MVRPCQGALGAFSKFLLNFPLPGLPLAHLPALRRVALVCRVSASPQIASLSHFHRPSYVIIYWYCRKVCLFSSLATTTSSPRLPSICIAYRQSDLTPPGRTVGESALLRSLRTLCGQPDTTATKATCLVVVSHRAVVVPLLRQLFHCFLLTFALDSILATRTNCSSVNQPSSFVGIQSYCKLRRATTRSHQEQGATWYDISFVLASSYTLLRTCFDWFLNWDSTNHHTFTCSFPVKQSARLL
jgi:hypothetical protein